MSLEPRQHGVNFLLNNEQKDSARKRFTIIKKTNFRTENSSPVKFLRKLSSQPYKDK